MTQLTVIDVRKMPSADPKRIGKSDFWITYQLDAMHIYTFTLGVDALTDDVMQKAIAADYATLTKYQGKTFNV